MANLDDTIEAAGQIFDDVVDTVEKIGSKSAEKISEEAADEISKKASEVLTAEAEKAILPNVPERVSGAVLADDIIDTFKLAGDKVEKGAPSLMNSAKMSKEDLGLLDKVIENQNETVSVIPGIDIDNYKLAGAAKSTSEEANLNPVPNGNSLEALFANEMTNTDYAIGKFAEPVSLLQQEELVIPAKEEPLSLDVKESGLKQNLHKSHMSNKKKKNIKKAYRQDKNFRNAYDEKMNTTSFIPRRSKITAIDKDSDKLFEATVGDAATRNTPFNASMESNERVLFSRAYKNYDNGVDVVSEKAAEELNNAKKSFADMTAQDFKQESKKSPVGYLRNLRYQEGVNAKKIVGTDKAADNKLIKDIASSKKIDPLKVDKNMIDDYNQNRIAKASEKDMNFFNYMGYYKVPQIATGIGGTAWLVNNLASRRGKQTNAELYGQQPLR